MNCVKCGAELRDDQKVCIQCGTRTAAGGHFHIEEKERWKPTRTTIYAAAGVALVLIIVLIVNGLRVVPPEVIAKEWFDAMVQREYNKAERYHSRPFAEKMQDGIDDTRAISDDLLGKAGSNPQITVSKFPSQSPAQATVMITYKSPDGELGQVFIYLAKQGRRWLITNVGK